MLCLYINLDRQTERRAFVETSFAQFAASAWQLQRIPAIDAETAVTLRSNSRLRPVETACFLSHVKAIETALQDNGPVMICEDDVRFGPQTSRVVPKIISELYPENWDLLFTDIGFGDPKVMIDLFRLRQGMMQKREVHCLKSVGLSGIFWCHCVHCQSSVQADDTGLSSGYTSERAIRSGSARSDYRPETKSPIHLSLRDIAIQIRRSIDCAT